MRAEPFANLVLKKAKSARAFRPTATYDRDGDCIEFLAEPHDFYAERVDDLVTVYYSHRTRQVIGSLIKGVSRFRDRVLRRFPGFRIVIQDGRIRLEHVFLARMWLTDLKRNDLRTLTYRKLYEVAVRTGVEAEMSAR